MNALSAVTTVPSWDSGGRELRLGAFVVKRFRQPAKNQEAILAAFQEENWPAHIDDPLPGDPEYDAMDRLHETIRRLNQQKRPLIRFLSDGLGQGVIWELWNSKPPKKRPSRDA